MEPHIDVITLAVGDLERSLEFYRDGLGLETAGIVGSEYSGDDVTPAGAAAMFKLRGGLFLLLYPRTELAKDANIPLAPGQSGEFSIGHAVADKAEVDAVLAAPSRPARRSQTGPTIARGASTPATSATSTVTFGRSCGTRGWSVWTREAGAASA
jgi:uncharacterized protein